MTTRSYDIIRAMLKYIIFTCFWQHGIEVSTGKMLIETNKLFIYEALSILDKKRD